MIQLNFAARSTTRDFRIKLVLNSSFIVQRSSFNSSFIIHHSAFIICSSRCPEKRLDGFINSIGGRVHLLNHRFELLKIHDSDPFLDSHK